VPERAREQKANVTRRMREFERKAIHHAIEICGYIVPAAAVLLSISVATFYRKHASWE